MHSAQLETFSAEAVDIASAFTITHPGEAIGIISRARELGLPFALSFTVETDGRLPTGQELGSALDEVETSTNGYCSYYGINCAHPEHFVDDLPNRWLNRIGMIRPDASRLSHAELDEATELDDGHPEEFGALYAKMARRLPALRVIGGCCGTDMRHIKAVMAAGVWRYVEWHSTVPPTSADGFRAIWRMMGCPIRNASLRRSSPSGDRCRPHSVHLRREYAAAQTKVCFGKCGQTAGGEVNRQVWAVPRHPTTREWQVRAPPTGLPLQPGRFKYPE